MGFKICRHFLSLMLAVLVCSSISCGERQDNAEESVADLLGLLPPRPARSPTGPDGPEPRTASGYIALSLQYYGQGEWEESIVACINALNLNPSSSIAYNNICSSYIQLKDYDRAIAACEKAIRLDPDFQLAKNNLNAAVRDKAGAAP